MRDVCGCAFSGVLENEVTISDALANDLVVGRKRALT